MQSNDYVLDFSMIPVEYCGKAFSHIFSGVSNIFLTTNVAPPLPAQFVEFHLTTGGLTPSNNIGHVIQCNSKDH